MSYTSSEIAEQYKEMIHIHGGLVFAMEFEAPKIDTIRRFPGTITHYTIPPTPYAIGLHLDAFIRANPSVHCVNHVLQDPGFIRVYFPFAHSHFKSFLAPTNQSGALVALVRAADVDVRLAMLPESRFLLTLDEEVLVAALLDVPGFLPRVIAKEKLAAIASTFFFQRPLVGSRLWYRMLFLAKGLLKPWQVTRLLRLVDPSKLQWPFLTCEGLPDDYAETKWWPFSEVHCVRGTSMHATAEVAQLHRDMKTLDLLVLQLFFKKGFQISDMGLIASFFSIHDFVRRVWFFVSHSTHLKDSYLSRTQGRKRARYA